LEPHEKAGAVVEVPIHEQPSQDKSLEKLFHTRIIGTNVGILHTPKIFRLPKTEQLVVLTTGALQKKLQPVR
jgi:hypothetical protein